jgi:hypothetical protein
VAEHDIKGVVATQIDDVRAVFARPVQPLIDQVDTDHPTTLSVCGDAARHRADRAEAEYHQRAAV